MRRGGYTGLACAVTLLALWVPNAAYATAGPSMEAIGVPGALASGQRVAAAPTRTRFVAFNGVQVTVPATWPVIDLQLHPRTCVRFDRAAVYLGSPGPRTDCPAHAVGRNDTIWLRTITAGRNDLLASQEARVGSLAARVGLNSLGHGKQVQFVSRAVELEATWGADSSSINQVLASAVESPGQSSPAPAATTSVSGISLSTVGVVLMVVGIAGLVISRFLAPRRCAVRAGQHLGVPQRSHRCRTGRS